MVVKAEHPGPLQKKAQKAPREPLDPNMMSFPLMMSHRTSRPKSANPHFLDFLPPSQRAYLRKQRLLPTDCWSRLLSICFMARLCNKTV